MSRRTVSGKISAPLLISLLFLVFIINGFQPFIAFAHTGDEFSAWASTTPMIDGKLAPGYLMMGEWYPGEWEGADKIDFDLSWGPELHDASLYVMNDYVNLYIAFEIKAEDYDFGDCIWINFDNNHDGYKDVYDDVLYLDAHSAYAETFAGRFQDGWWFSPGDEYPEPDNHLWGGTYDGVGACKFTGTTPYEVADYIFEVAHPLNTSDDFHDFSLKVGDTVGFNVLYMDDGGGPGSQDGWPEFTKLDWSQMADIKIADPDLLFFLHGNVNLKIDKIEITQAIQWLNDAGYEDNSVPLVYGKSTLVRVYVDVGAAVAAVGGVEVYLYATIAGWSRASPGLFGDNGPLRQSFNAPINPIRGNVNHTANFLLPDYWVKSSHVTLKAFVKAPSWQNEMDYTDNWMMFEDSPQQTFIFKSTRDLTIYMVPFDVTWASPRQPTNQEILEQEQYLLAAYPVADVNFIHQSPFTWNGHSKDEAIDDLNVLALDLGLRHPTDLMFGMLPTSVGQWGGQSDPDWDIRGYGGGLRFVAVGTTNWSTSLEGLMAHEFIHNLGPGTEEDGVLRGWGLHSSSDADWPYPTLSIKTFGMSAAWGWPPLVISRLTPDIMSQVNPTNFSPTKWISPYRWENLMSYLDPPAAASTASIQQAGESLVISGWISENGTGSLRSIFRLPEAQESPSSPSNYSLVLKDSSGSTLLTHSFGVRFVDLDGEKHDPDYFTVLLPHLTGTQSVSLWNGTILLDQITASAYAPQVQVISPNGGETAENLFTVAWAASDLDGDPLTFKVFYSGDNGLSWTPVSPRIVGTAYLVNASRLPGGSQSLIRVVASDGFHTSEDQSDAVFTVPRKAPLDVVSFGMNPCIHNFGEPVVLKGSAFDPEDGVLNGTALTWFSDLNGTLGTGRVLTTTDLIPGTHNITLTATDSDGNNATYSFTVTVELRNVRIVEASSDRERAFRAQIVDVRATVSNPSDVYIVEPFNVSAYAHSEDPNKPPLLIGTQFVPDLQPKANLTIQFLWNTTGAPTGYYTISAIATPVIGEIDTSDNMFIDGLILITKAGDLGGGIPPKFFNFDDKVDGKDLALFIQCYRGLAPPEAMYLGDLGGGLPPQFFNFDSKVDGKDLALFIECYRGQGPDP